MYCIQNAFKSYRHKSGEVVALKSSSMEIHDGEFVAVVGPSGSGKTTLLSMLGGMLAPTSGHVWLNGQSIYELNIAKRAAVRQKTIGFVFQTFNLLPYLSALENAQVPLMLAGSSTEQQQKQVFELLRRVGLECRLHHKPAELSIGQQQRVALARTLVSNPSVILADEPTGNLDPDTREQVLSFLEELTTEGRTVIMVTHDPAAAARARRVIRLQEGAIVSDSKSKMMQVA